VICLTVGYTANLNAVREGAANSGHGLIVHADDFGETVEITRGICAAIDAGAVTSTSIMANMPGTADALLRVAPLAERASFGVAAPPWPRMTFAEAVSRFGTDRPDTRFGVELHDLGALLSGSEFQVFAGALRSGGVVRGINAGPRELPRSELDALTELAKQHGAKGLVWAFVQEDGSWRSPIAKFLSPAEIEAIGAQLGVSPGDLLLIVADEATTVGQSLGALRLELARRFDLVPEGRHDVLWVVEFPMFQWHPEEQRWDALHHPFTAPIGDLDHPDSLLSRAYDLVLDGSEIGGGSIRINRTDVQTRVLELLGIGEDIALSGFPLRPPACLIAGGETTVTLRGKGKGGRNQEMALAFLAALPRSRAARDIVFLAASTDGNDGPTDAAGAIADGETVARNPEARRYLDRNDSYHYFQSLGDLVITGPTNTNVMDVRLILVASKA